MCLFRRASHPCLGHGWEPDQWLRTRKKVGFFQLPADPSGGVDIIIHAPCILLAGLMRVLTAAFNYSTPQHLTHPAAPTFFLSSFHSILWAIEGWRCPIRDGTFSDPLSPALALVRSLQFLCPPQKEAVLSKAGRSTRLGTSAQSLRSSSCHLPIVPLTSPDTGF